MFTKRSKIAIMISTVHSSTTAVAEAEGYCNSPISLEISRPTFALWLPDMKRTVMKSPITSVSTKIVPIMMPDGETAVWTTAQLFEQNICTFPMIFPVVPRNTERLRFFISAAHTREHIDRTVELLVDLRKNAPASKGLF